MFDPKLLGISKADFNNIQGEPEAMTFNEATRSLQIESDSPIEYFVLSHFLIRQGKIEMLNVMHNPKTLIGLKFVIVEGILDLNRPYNTSLIHNVDPRRRY